MSEEQIYRRQSWRLVLVGLIFAIGCAGGALLALRADAQAPARPPAVKPSPPMSPSDANALIKDDPTVAPDSQESADNNVTFPVDI